MCSVEHIRARFLQDYSMANETRQGAPGPLPGATGPNDEVDVAPGTSGRPACSEVLEDLVARRLRARRSFLKGLASIAAGAPLFSFVPSFLYSRLSEAADQRADSLAFDPITGTSADEVIVPDGYRADVLLRWGDSLVPGTPGLDTDDLGVLLTNEGIRRQEQQFGYNCDFNAFFPLGDGSPDGSGHGLLAVNHEYTSEELMLPGWPGERSPLRVRFVRRHPAVVGLMKAAHGVSIAEIQRRDSGWELVKGSPFNRRLTADSPMDFSGPAAAHPLLRTQADQAGQEVRGTLNNCAGGKTPWGTVLTCEENFDQYFGNFEGLLTRAGSSPEDPIQKYVDFHRRIPPPRGLSPRAWELVDQRFNVAAHPTEPFRFGWVVEIDPYTPGAKPKKRTGLGRFKHEGATTVVAPDGRVVVYSGDDARFEYVYKFVTDGRYDPNDRAANMDLLDSGTLSVGRFSEDGTGEWLPLVHGQAPLDAAHGFRDQGEVLINARAAADLLGATPMDRPEDIEANPRSGKVYVSLTNNTGRRGGERKAQGRQVRADADAMNPRAPNRTGHILELSEAGNDPTSTAFHWDVFILCGDPHRHQLLTSLHDTAVAATDTYFAGFGRADELSPLAAPDNVAFDRAGNLWIATDGARHAGLRINDGVYAVPTTGQARGHLRQFLSGPRGSEICGPEFTPDASTLFIGVQHPGEGGSLRRPVSDWPDRGGRPPRPSVVAIAKNDGGTIGT